MYMLFQGIGAFHFTSRFPEPKVLSSILWQLPCSGEHLRINGAGVRFSSRAFSYSRYHVLGLPYSPRMTIGFSCSFDAYKLQAPQAL